MDGRAPGPGIARHRRIIAGWSDAELIERLLRIEPLPDREDDPAWADDAAWDRADFLLAAADAIGDRRLLAAIGPLFRRAALEDCFELMQGLRHGSERAVAPRWHELAAIMQELVRDQRPGCRRWAVRELGILREAECAGDLITALADPQPEVRAEACMSLGMVAAAASPHVRDQVREHLAGTSQRDESAQVRRAARDAIEQLT